MAAAFAWGRSAPSRRPTAGTRVAARARRCTMARERDAARPSAIERWVHGVSTNIGAGLVRAVDEARDAREPGASTRTMVQGVLHEVGLELGESGDGPLGRAIRATARGAVLDV